MVLLPLQMLPVRPTTLIPYSAYIVSRDGTQRQAFSIGNHGRHVQENPLLEAKVIPGQQLHRPLLRIPASAGMTEEGAGVPPCRGLGCPQIPPICPQE